MRGERALLSPMMCTFLTADFLIANGAAAFSDIAILGHQRVSGHVKSGKSGPRINLHSIQR